MAQRLNRRGLVLAGLIAGFVGIGAVAPVMSQVSSAVTTDQAPPLARYERVPPPRTGYQWAPGYWRWNAPDQRFAWVGGYWVQRRAGQRYVPENWAHQHGQWQLQRGHWVR